MQDDTGIETAGPAQVGQAAFVPLHVEALTEQFYAWESRGRGWHLWPHPVALEPPFVPFVSHSVAFPAFGLDDGRRHTFFSDLLERTRRFVFGPTAHDQSIVPFEVEDIPKQLSSDAQLVELRLIVPPSLKISRDTMARLVASLPVGVGPLAFEVIGAGRAIWIQFVVDASHAAQVLQLVNAFFPEIVVTTSEDALSTRWPAGGEVSRIIADFGLSREFMLPLQIAKTYDADPLIGVTAALSDLLEEEVALLQVMFEPVRNPWAASMIRAAYDGTGQPFLSDAPEVASGATAKVAAPLFAVVIRIGIRSSDLERLWSIARALGGALQCVSHPAGNALIPLTNENYEPEDHESDLLRRQSHRSGMILNVDELHSLVHPPSASVRSERLERDARKTRPAPAVATEPGVVLGTNTHAGKLSQVALTADQRSRHMYVIGASGTGKSTLLLNMIAQDLVNGEGIAVLDPHGDLIDQILLRVPDHRINDVVLFDPADAEYPVGFNILSAHSELEKTLLSSDLVAVFRRLSTSWGDQMTSVLGNAILAFLESDRGGTLLDLRRFLVEKAFREEFLRSVRDPSVVYYWQKEFPLLRGNPQSPILTRLDAFLRPKLIRHMVAQQGDRLAFRAMMDQGKILLARLSQGAIGEENAYLLGTLLVSKLQQTAISRQETQEAARRPFYVYVDEFQNFVTPTMEQILSGARKYRLGLVLAHQELRQVASRSPEVLNSVLSNPYTRVCFRVGDADARTLADGFASFDAKDLQNLGTGQALVRVERADCDFNLATSVPPTVDDEASHARRELIVTRSRSQYATPREEVEAKLYPVASATGRPESVEVESNQSETPPLPSTPAEPRRESRPAKAVAPVPAVPPSPGRGGQQHKYLQELVRRWAQSREWLATIEEQVLSGMGSVDVSLKKGEHSIACEIAVTTDAEHEIGNMQKCLAAGFSSVVMISPEKKTLAKLRAAVSENVAEQDRERVHVCTPEEAFVCLESIEASLATTTKTSRGYKVKVKYRATGAGEKNLKRDAVSQVLASALKRLGR